LEVTVCLAFIALQIVLGMLEKLEERRLDASVVHFNCHLCAPEARTNLRLILPQIGVESFGEGEDSCILYFFVFVDADDMLGTRI